MDDDEPTREELIAAREDLQRELERIRNPNHGNFGSPPLEVKLLSLIREIEESLAAMPPDDAKPETRY